MKAKIALALAVLVPALCMAAPANTRVSAVQDAEPFHITAALKKDSNPQVRFNVDVPPGEGVIVTTRAGLRLEIDAAHDGSQTDQTTVRLFDVSSGEPVMLHSSRSMDTAGAPRTINYTVCKGEATFSSSLDAQSCSN